MKIKRVKNLNIPQVSAVLSRWIFGGWISKQGRHITSQQDLMTGRYEVGNRALFSCKEVAEAAKKNLDHRSFLPRLGVADKMIEKHLEAAKEGSSFLVIYAPDKVSSDRAMNVILRVPF